MKDTRIVACQVCGSEEGGKELAGNNSAFHCMDIIRFRNDNR
jgi:hypothetical protein